MPENDLRIAKNRQQWKKPNFKSRRYISIDLSSILSLLTMILNSASNSYWKITMVI